MFHDPPRYENSYYGPIDGILNSIFPTSHTFIVKPQAILRPSQPTVSSVYLSPGSPSHPNATRSSPRIPDAAARTAAVAGLSSHHNQTSISSLDSLGDKTLARTVGGWEDSLLKPDFLVVKGSVNTRNDIAVALVEVKVNDDDEAISILQVDGYIEALQTKNCADEFVAFLCMGARTLVWTTSVHGDNRVQTMRPQHISTGSMAFCNLMLPARQRYW